MASRNELDMEKQFLAELEKAKALSLETFELEKIRQQRYSQPETLSKSDSRTLAEYKTYLERRAKLHQALPPGSNNEGSRSATISTNTANLQPGYRSDNDTRSYAQDSRPPRGKDEADLISFNAPPAPPNPQDEAHNNLKELVDKMHRMNTTPNTYEQSFKTQRSLSMTSATSYGAYPPAYLQQQVVQSYNPAAMQLVPYNQQIVKPKPLTHDELNRLYNMPVYGSPAPQQAGYVTQPQYSASNYSQASRPFPPQQVHPNSTATNFIPQPVAPTVATGFIPQPSLYSNSTSPVANPESALVHVPKPVVPKLTLDSRSAAEKRSHQTGRR